MSFAAPRESDSSHKSERFYWLDYLRGLNIVATLLFHAFLAYSPFVQASQLSVLPIPYVDVKTSLPIADVLLLVRPIFSMQLMFFISGLFTWRGLQKRGSYGYLVVRFKRLIIPLLFTWLLAMPITYIPGFIENQLTFYPIRFAHLWFLWVLFCFDIVAAFLFYKFRFALERFIATLSPIRFAQFISLLVIIAYLMFVYQAGDTGWLPLFGSHVFILPYAWIGLYFYYFILGVVIGSRSLNPQIMTTNWLSPFAPSTRGLIPACIISTLVFGSFLLSRLKIQSLIGHLGTHLAWGLLNILYALSGLIIVMTMILLSKRFLHHQNRWLDNLAANSYGFYLVHYTFVVWLQYLLSRTLLPDLLKPFIVIFISIPLSWLAADALRHFPFSKNSIVAG